MTSPAANSVTVAQSALEELMRGLQTGQWQALRDRLTADVTIWFPKEPFQGLNRGQDQTIALLQSIPWPPNRTIAVERITCNGTSVMLELRVVYPQGTSPGRERAAIAFQIQGHQVSAIQPYLLLFHPAPP